MRFHYPVTITWEPGPRHHTFFSKLSGLREEFPCFREGSFMYIPDVLTSYSMEKALAKPELGQILPKHQYLR